MGIIISSTLGCGKDELINEYSDKIKIDDISDIEIDDEFINKVNDLSDDNDILFVSSSNDVIDKGEYIYNNNKILKYIENIISSGDKSKE